MFRFNLAYEPMMFVLHRIIFIVSPIDRLRFDREHQERLREIERRLSIAPQPTEVDHYDPETALVDHQQQQSDDTTDQPDWWALTRPLQLAGLIKRYHMVGNTFVVYFIAQNMILLHLTVKCFIHTLVTRDDPQMLAYFNSIYYPHLAGFLPEPHRFNQLLTCLSAYCFSIRALRAYFLIRGSIVNATRYKELYISQTIFGSMSSLNLTLKEWIRYFRIFVSYRKDPRDPAYLRLSHRVHSQVDTLDKIDRMYYYNLMDFDAMFAEIWGTLDLENRTDEQRHWHCALPACRIDFNLMTLSICLAWFALFGCSSNFTICLYWVASGELRSSLPHDTDHSIASTGEIFARWYVHLSEPAHLIRLLEVCLLICFLSFGNYDVCQVCADSFALVQRVKKLIHLLEQDLDYARQLSTSAGGVMLRQGSIVGYRHFIHGHNSKPSDKRQQAAVLNARVEHHIKLAGCMHSEFNDTKHSHLVYLNILVISSGICMSYTISMFFVMESKTELSLLITGSLSSFYPLIFTLILCALLERSFRNLYRAITKLVWNHDKILTRATVYHLMMTSRKFESQESRSFSVGGLYAITQSSVLPFLAYMASAVLYLERFGLVGHQ